MKRVVVTGAGALTPLGFNWSDIESRLRAKKGGITYREEWDDVVGLRGKLAAAVPEFSLPPHYDRKALRSMGRVALLATRATELALEDSGLLGDPVLRSGLTGVAYGSCIGGTDALAAFAGVRLHRQLRGISAASSVQMMSHTCAANIGIFFKLTGRVIPTCSACTSGSQAIGYSAEMIRSGKQLVMLAGGAEELCVTLAAAFDVMLVTSTRHSAPNTTPRPFDRNRDGLVVGEGATTLILEELEHAQARGAKIYAELVGFGSNSDGSHVTTPEPVTMRRAMELALEDAGIPADAVGYVNAHATATEQGDIFESLATHQVFGDRMPISSLKGYFGHTLGACGALEAWLSIEMQRAGWFAPNLNLEELDPRCAPLDYIVSDGRKLETDYVMSNNFAFGGVNSSLIFKRWK